MEQSDTASCPECGAEMPITAEHNGIAWVGHGICAKCGWASQHALPDDSQTQHGGQQQMKRSEMQSVAPSGYAALPPVLDACCGSRMMWFDGKDSRAIYMDRDERTFIKDKGTDGTKGRAPIIVAPDVKADFTAMPFPDESFWHVVFDPPHYTDKSLTPQSCLAACFGVLLPGWEEMLQAGFAECFRVLKPNGTLVFKWCSTEIPLCRVLALTPEKPLYGHRSGKRAQTHWVTFLKHNT